MIFKNTVVCLFLSSTVTGVLANTEDATETFAPAIKAAEVYFGQDKICGEVLTQSWHRFSGEYNYHIVEKNYIDGALKATLCGLNRGWFISLMLDELKILSNNGFVKKNGREAAIAEAQKRFLKIPISKVAEFPSSVNCNANTPRISYSGHFENIVMVTCSSNKGPVKVDLASMRIQVGGLDAWNGPDREFFGKSVRKALRGG